MDFLNVGSNQRIDADDLQYGVSMSQINASRIATANILTSGGNWVINGFQTSNPSGTKTLLVNGGTAILSWRTGAVIVHGMVIAPPDGTGGSAQQVSQTLDLSSYAAGTYGVYICFNFSNAAYQGRTFWTTATVGSEQSKSTPTRQQAVWQTRVEVNNPGAEWVQIAQVVVASGGSITSVTDTRPLFYEGAGGSPAYANTWGTATDRNANRATYGIGDLKTFVDAVKTCLEDIKGPGLARWYSPYVAGMNIGSGFTSQTVTQDRLCLGDSNFYIDTQVQPAGQRWWTMNFDNSGGFYFKAYRFSNPASNSLALAAPGGINIAGNNSLSMSAGSGYISLTSLGLSGYTQIYSAYNQANVCQTLNIYQQYASSPATIVNASLNSVNLGATYWQFAGNSGITKYGAVGQLNTTQFGLSQGNVLTPFFYYDSTTGNVYATPGASASLITSQSLHTQTYALTGVSPPDLRTSNASNCVVCWGYSGVSANKGNCYNVASITYPATGTTRITFARAVSAYVAMPIDTNDNTKTFLSIGNVQTTSFDIYQTDASNGSAVNRNVAWICIGQP